MSGALHAFELSSAADILNSIHIPTTTNMDEIERRIEADPEPAIFRWYIRFQFWKPGPFIIVAWIPVLFIFWNIQQKYRVTARELKRLTSIARSPIFAHFNETVTSLTVSIST